MKIAIIIIAILFILVFILPLMNFDAFMEFIQSIDFLNTILIPVLNIITAVSQIITKFRRIFTIVSLYLFLVFIANVTDLF